jgi:hypothetical protein
VLPVFYNDSYVCAAHSFDTTRKAGWIAESLARDPIEGVEIRSPRSLTFDQIASVHDADYVRAVETGEPRSLSESQGFAWDPGLWKVVLASNGGIVEAALAALRFGDSVGSLSSGLHHARRDSSWQRFLQESEGRSRLSGKPHPRDAVQSRSVGTRPPRRFRRSCVDATTLRKYPIKV